MIERERMFFDKANSIDEIFDIIKNNDIALSTHEEKVMQKIIDALNAIKGSDKEKEYIDFIHKAEDIISVTSTKYHRPKIKKNLLTLGTIARAYVDDYDQYKSYTPWQQVLLAYYYDDWLPGVEYNPFTREVMDTLVGLNGPSEEEIKEYREEVFSQIYRKNVCRKGQIEFLLTDDVDIQKIYDIIGDEPKKRGELTEEEKERVTDILLLRGPEEHIVKRQFKNAYGIMVQFDYLNENIFDYSIKDVGENNESRRF